MADARETELIVETLVLSGLRPNPSPFAVEKFERENQKMGRDAIIAYVREHWGAEAAGHAARLPTMILH